MSTAVIVMVAVMAFASIGMMFIAIIEFVMYMRNSRKDQQPVFITAPVAAQPEPVKEPEPAPAPAPAPEAEEVVVVEEADENSVTFELAEAHRPTIKEAYEGLKKIEQELYDKIIVAANELEMARVIESTYAVTIMQGRDNIGKLRILRGVVTLDCTVINPDLVKYNKENGKKIKSRPTRFRIESSDELDAAIYTLKVANQTSLENRNVRKKVEKETTNEQ
jgi:hypothetical protein